MQSFAIKEQLATLECDRPERRARIAKSFRRRRVANEIENIDVEGNLNFVWQLDRARPEVGRLDRAAIDINPRFVVDVVARFVPDQTPAVLA